MVVNVLRVPNYTSIKQVNCESVPRAWHTASYLPTKNLLVTFGGERTQPRANGSNGPPEVY